MLKKILCFIFIVLITLMQGCFIRRGEPLKKPPKFFHPERDLPWRYDECLVPKKGKSNEEAKYKASRIRRSSPSL